MSRSLTRLLIGFGALVVVLAASAPALGQFGGFGQDQGGRLSRTQLEQFGSMLELDQTQREIAQMMLEEYLDGVQTTLDIAREASREARQEFEETRDRSVFAGLREVNEAARDRVEELESQFMGDLRMMLTPEQDEAWPRVERAHRRAKSLPRGLMSGERVDLFEIVRDLELEGEHATEAQAVLEEYELALDRVLATRDEAYAKGMELFRQRDFEALQEHFEDARDSGMRVRDVHRSYARRLEAVVPEAKLETMRSAIRRASFPSVYREDRSSRALTFVNGVEGLSDEQRSQVEAIELSNERRLGEVNRKIADAIERNEANMSIRDLMRGGQRATEDGTRELFREKREVIDRTIEQLRALLTEDQAASMDEALGAGDAAEDGENRRGRRGGRQRQAAPGRS